MRMDLRLSVLKEMKLPVGQYAIFGSYPLYACGLKKKPKDLDLIVVPAVWKSFLKRPDWRLKVSTLGSKYLVKNGIEMYPDWKPGRWSVEKLIKNSATIEGLPFVSLKDVLRWKKAYNRKKDGPDIRAIAEHLKDSAVKK